MDPRNHPLHTKELGRAAKERFVVRVETNSFMTEQSAEVKEITRAAAKIQDAERARPIEPEVLHALDVNIDPVARVLVGVDSSRIRAVGITVAQPL